MSAHTPGPWKIGEFNESTGCYQISGHEQVLNLAFVQDYSDMGEPSDEEAKANARLIAAAPDLLAALEALLAVSECADETGYVDDCGFVDLEKVQANARAAIAKAKGETK